MNPRLRFRFAAWSTFGQIALLIFAALTVAQAFAFFALRNISEEWRSFVVIDPAVGRFAEVAREVEAAPESARQGIVQAASTADQEFELTRSFTAFSPPHQEALEDSLKSALRKRGVRFSAVNAFEPGGPFAGMHRGPRPFGGPPADSRFDGPPPRQGAGPPDGPFAGPPEDSRFDGLPPRQSAGRPGGPPPGHFGEHVMLAARLPDGAWLTARFVAFRPMPLLLNPFFVSQFALFLAVLAVSLFWASRISRPLRMLAEAAENLRPQEQLTPIPEEGPREVRAAILSFNSMARRVRELLQEKDRMLSAIGHDLRTPLASLRIRAESVEPESERERFIDSIDEMTRMTDEILNLARLGQTTEPMLLVDLSALADSLVEEFRELGKDVTFVEAPRTPLKMQPGLVRRLLRNLIDNAVKYGERARVFIVEGADDIALCVEDEGPGIPEAALADVLRPFTRLENSRSRQTGGMGLGLSIADAIARSQGATLILENRSPTGLRVSVKWPKPAAEG